VLWTRHGLPAGVYEANAERLGGRCWTLRDYFSGGLVTEHGGAFIDSVHVATRRLAHELELGLEVVNGGDLPRGEDIYFIGGRYYTRAEASADWAAVGYRAFRKAARELESEAGELRLDAMSVPAWLDSTPIGAGSRLGRLLLANTVTENGGDPGEQSALDLIQITAGGPRATLELLPGDDERYHVIGGNDQLATGMAERLPAAAVHTGHRLIALRARADRTAALIFERDGQTVEQRADLVVLALPFSTLREVDLSASGLSPSKQQVIASLGMGTNAKLHVELTHKTWPALGFAGVAYGAWDGFCCAWDDSVPQGANARPALLLGFPGGRVGARTLTGAAHGPAPASDRDWLLRQLEPVFGGTTAAATGRAYEDHWALDPHVHGAYSYFRVGQAASFGQVATRAEPPYHFAGEHTSSRFQGFLEGAVESGERAAGELVRRL
jgi:monoamine oxidase